MNRTLTYLIFVTSVMALAAPAGADEVLHGAVPMAASYGLGHLQPMPAATPAPKANIWNLDGLSAQIRSLFTYHVGDNFVSYNPIDGTIRFKLKLVLSADAARN